MNTIDFCRKETVVLSSRPVFYLLWRFSTLPMPFSIGRPSISRPSLISIQLNWNWNWTIGRTTKYAPETGRWRFRRRHRGPAVRRVALLRAPAQPVGPLGAVRGGRIAAKALAQLRQQRDGADALLGLGCSLWLLRRLLAGRLRMDAQRIERALQQVGVRFAGAAAAVQQDVLVVAVRGRLVEIVADRTVERGRVVVVVIVGGIGIGVGIVGAVVKRGGGRSRWLLVVRMRRTARMESIAIII